MGIERRSVTLVLVDGDGSVLGALPAYDVALPYWQEVSDVVAGARERFDVDVSVLRLLCAERSEPHGGAVTYLAEVDADSCASPSHNENLRPASQRDSALAAAEEPLRLPYARPGGPAATVGWALAQIPPETIVAQQRTWNLSAIWRLVGPEQTYWLKQVPPFFAHEPAVLRWADRAVPGSVPELVQSGPDGRMLLEHVDGADLYEADAHARGAVVAAWFRLQRASVPDVERLAADGVPDLRGHRLGTWIRSQLADHAAGHPAEALLANLDRTLASVAECGVPDALAHGDAHPGNAIRRGSGEIVLLDFGDAFIGHPGFDALRVTIGLRPDDQRQVLQRWTERWAADVPECDPSRALKLLRSVECLRLAAVYARFLANIEPGERCYHAADVPLWLDRAVVSAYT